MPETQLAVQSAVLGRASAFVGTYGGFAQLALRMGRASVSFYDQWEGTSAAHHHLSQAISIQSGVPFQIYKLSELGLTQAILPQVSVKRLTSLESTQKAHDSTPVLC
jgi:hypothetical protein